MRGSGRVVFAAILLLIAGTLNLIYGFGALDDANIFVNDTRFIFDNLNTLGWVLLLLGALQLIAGFSLMAGNTFGRVIGIIAGSLGAIGALLSVGGAIPWWSLAIFALCLYVVHGIVVFGEDESPPRAASSVSGCGGVGANLCPDSSSQPRSASCIARTPTIGPAGSLHEAGTTANGWICQPPMPPCDPMNSSKGATSLASGSNMQLTRMSGQWAKPSVRRRWPAALGPKCVRGSSPVTSSSRSRTEPLPPNAIGPAPSSPRTMMKPMPGMAREGRHQPGVQPVDLADGHPLCAPVR